LHSLAGKETESLDRVFLEQLGGPSVSQLWQRGAMFGAVNLPKKSLCSPTSKSLLVNDTGHIREPVRATKMTELSWN